MTSREGPIRLEVLFLKTLRLSLPDPYYAKCKIEHSLLGYLLICPYDPRALIFSDIERFYLDQNLELY